MLSGFVILMSVSGRNANYFLLSRIKRLYPAYLVAVLFTTAVVVILNQEKFILSAPQVLINLTMLPKLVGTPFVDGVYWTLMYEIGFYFWIFSLLLIKQEKHIVNFSWVLLVACMVSYIIKLPQAMEVLFLTKFCGYFISGMVFYKLYRSRIETGSVKFTVNYVLLLLASFAANCAEINHQFTSKNASFPIEFSSVEGSIIILVFYLFFYVVALGTFDNTKIRYASTLGGLTYPIYLIHQNFGYSVFNTFGASVNREVLLFSVCVTSVLISFGILKYVEPPLRILIDKLLKPILFKGEPIRD